MFKSSNRFLSGHSKELPLQELQTESASASAPASHALHALHVGASVRVVEDFMVGNMKLKRGHVPPSCALQSWLTVC